MSTLRSRRAIALACVVALGICITVRRQASPGDAVIESAVPDATPFVPRGIDPLRHAARVVRGAGVPAPRMPHGGKPDSVTAIVSSTEDYKPVRGARIEVCGRVGGPHVFAGDSRGRVTVPLTSIDPNDGLTVIASAPGYCRRLLTLYPSDVEVVLGLVPSGALEVEIVDEAGDPVPETAVTLLPPRDDGRPWRSNWRGFDARGLGPGPEEVRSWAARAAASGTAVSARELGLPYSPPETPSLIIAGTAAPGFSEAIRDCIGYDKWTVRTDEDGVATWSDIPATGQYQWGAPEARVIEHDPPALAPPAPAETGSIALSTNDPSREISGRFELRKTGVTRFRATIARATRVLGAVVSARPEPPRRVVVKLYHWASSETVRAQGYESIKIEQSAWASRPGGEFDFRGVAPGKKSIKVWWREKDNHIFFGDRVFHLRSGETQDLGVIEPRAGSTVEVDIVLFDESGKRIDPSLHANTIAEGECYLAVVVWPDDRDPGSSPGGRVSVNLGRVTTLHGLPTGKYSFGLSWNDAFSAHPGTRLRLPEHLEVRVDGNARLQLGIRMERVVSQSIVARADGISLARAQAYLMNEGSGEVFKASLRPNGGQVLGTVELEPGYYRVLVHTQSLTKPGSTSSRIFVEERQLLDGTPLEVDMSPAASVDGIAFDADGLPLANKVLYLASGRHLNHERPTWTHLARTNAQGGFHLSGLEPGHEYRSHRGLTFTAGQADTLKSLGNLHPASGD